MKELKIKIEELIQSEQLLLKYAANQSTADKIEAKIQTPESVLNMMSFLNQTEQ